MAGTAKRQKTAIIYVRVDPGAKAPLRDQAKTQGRSLTNYLEWLAWQQSPQARQRQPAEMQ